MNCVTASLRHWHGDTSLSVPVLAITMISWRQSWFADDDQPGLPPGSPPTCKGLFLATITLPNFWLSVKFEGPWFTTQILLSTTIGATSFLLFSYCRTKWPLLFAPRTKLKGLSILLIRYPYKLICFAQGFPHMKLMLIRLFSVGYCQLLEPRSSLSCR